MTHPPFFSDIAQSDRDAYLGADTNKPLLRVVACGSDDPSKTALIETLAGGSKDSSGYRYVAGEKRRVLVTATPSQDTVTEALITDTCSADVAILMIDARNGVLPQTRWHALMLSQLGVKQITLGINTLDLTGYKQAAFDKIETDFRVLADDLSFDSVTAIPMAASNGGNIAEKSSEIPWFNGLTLTAYLDSVQISDAAQEQPFRMLVESANDTGAAGKIVSGGVTSGDKVKLLPSIKESSVSKITASDTALDQATKGQSVTLTLADTSTIAAGEVISTAAHPCEISDQFRATIFWMSDDELLPGRTYLMKIGQATAEATIAQPRHALDIDTMDERAARTLEKNDIGVCHLNLDRQIAFDPFSENRETGRFTIIDRLTNETVGVGLIDFALRRAANIHMQALDIDKGARSDLKGQRPAILWFTGLSGSGKSTIANALEKKLHAMGRHTAILDGDNVRHGLNQDLGFTDADRVENIRRVSEVGKLMVEAGLIVLVSFISPFRSERKMARQMMEDGEFVEIHVDTPLEVAEERDVKGLYAKARSGEIKNFTGIDSPYEAPHNPEIRLATTNQSPEEAADDLLTFLKANGYIG